MAPKGTPLTDDQRRALFDWVLADGADKVAASIKCSADSIANWVSGLCSPFQAQHEVVTRRLAARARKG